MEVFIFLDRVISNSQNFIHSKILVKKILSLSNLSEEDVVIEIGPGKGIITNELCEICNEVIAIEYDKDLCSKLQSNFNGIGNFKLINMDFMKYQLPNYQYKVFSNIPFNMTAEILQKLLDINTQVTDAYLIVLQYEAALKYIGKPYYEDCFRSLLYKPIFEAKIIYEFQPTDFSPQPSARIVLVHFHRRECSDIKLESYCNYRDFLAYVYTSSGKTFKEKTKNVFSYEQQKRLRKSCHIEFESSISSCTYEQWICLFDCYNKYVSKEKKSIVEGAYFRMLSSQKKINKQHRNRNRTKNEKKFKINSK